MSGERELQSVATLIMGTSPKGDTYNNDGVGTPLLNGPTEFGPVHPDCTLFTTKPLRMSGRGDLLLCVRGSTGRMNWADQPYALGRGVASIRADTGLETRFVRYCLEARLTSLLSRATGSTFTNLKVSDISTFPIPWPDSRQKVAVVLAAYDELIENNLRRIEILEEMVQAVYREWFVHFRFPGHEDVALVDSPLGPTPEEWEVSTLGEESTVVMGQSPKSEFYNDERLGLPFHQGVTHFGTLFPEHVKYCTVETRIAEAGDTLVSVRAPVGRINVADTRMVIGRGVAAIRATDEYRGFHFHQLRQVFREEDSMGGGTIYKAITKGDLLGIPWLVPPVDTKEAFDASERPMFSMMANLTRQTSNLRTTRDLLLPKLVSGEIDVSELDIDTESLAS